MLDLAAVRAQFPALALTHDGGPRTYLDNPAGTQVPQVVLDRMGEALVEFNANMHGNFRTSERATEQSHRAHAHMAEFYNARSDREIVFGPNMTTLTFQMARVLGTRFREGDEIITTHMEHEGNNWPWRTMAAERGLVVKTVPFHRDTYELDLDAFGDMITSRTRFAALNVASNLLGTINPVKQMVAALREAGAITYLDAVQYAPHGVIDVQELDCDFLVASSYKFYGPHQGILYGREELLSSLPAYKLRTVPDVTPDRYETGTQSLEGQAGVIGALEYLAWVGREFGSDLRPADGELSDRTRDLRAGMRAMVAHEETLSARLISGLQAIDGVHVHGITDPAAFGRRVPTVSITAPGLDPAALATFLDAHGVYVWNGHSYALPVVEFLGIADQGGVVRTGPTHYNTLDEIDRCVSLVEQYLGAH
ncbi:MAG: cysteine desulfurase-like protein [Acidimicrobiaceae bacterium]|nr:cysteine desulfurase-like protein [Acidimicrobiaceae bacterium]